MVAEAEPDDFRIIASFTNTRDRPISLRIEPWLEETEMAPGSRYFVLARGPEGGMAIELGADQVTLWGWVGSIVTAVEEGGEVDESFWRQPPVPTVPDTGRIAFRLPPGRG